MCNVEVYNKKKKSVLLRLIYLGISVKAGVSNTAVNYGDLTFKFIVVECPENFVNYRFLFLTELLIKHFMVLKDYKYEIRMLIVGSF